jgi:hypothetical protein
LIIGALSTHPGSANYFANRMPAVLWILAVGSYWTFAHRMYHTWREVWRADVEIAAAQAAKDASKTGRSGAGGGSSSSSSGEAKENSPASKIAPAPR